MRATFVLAAALSAAPAFAQDNPPPGFKIEDFSFYGNGCRPGSVVTNVSPDAKALTLVFDSFVVEASPDKRQMTRMCELDLRMKVPSGWSVALATLDARGFASLADGESHGKVRTLYAFGRSPEPLLLADEAFVGPFAADYHLRAEADVSTLEFSACGGKRLMRLRTRIDAKLAPRSQTGAALVTVDSLDHTVSQKYALVWKKCARDDAPDNRLPPDFTQSSTATCTAKQMRAGLLIESFEGSGTAMKKPMAQKIAAKEALRQCRLDRREDRPGRPHQPGRPPRPGRPGGQPAPGNGPVTCVVDEATCTFSET